MTESVLSGSVFASLGSLENSATPVCSQLSCAAPPPPSPLHSAKGMGDEREEGRERARGHGRRGRGGRGCGRECGRSARAIVPSLKTRRRKTQTAKRRVELGLPDDVVERCGKSTWKVCIVFVKENYKYDRV